MKTPSVTSVAGGLLTMALSLGFAFTGLATVVIEQTGPPVMTGSWDVGFYAHGSPFDTITATIISGAAFEDPGLRAKGWVSSGSDLVASISGPAVNALVLIGHFADWPPLPGATPPFILDFDVYCAGDQVGGRTLEWTGYEFDLVPEPSTMLTGVLLLIPFGASTLRKLRKNHAV